MVEPEIIKETLDDTDQRMTKAIAALKRELATIRTGRANPALVEQLKVDYYDTTTPLQQLASISVPEARLITIQPWDKGSLGAIERRFRSPTWASTRRPRANRSGCRYPCSPRSGACSSPRSSPPT